MLLRMTLNTTHRRRARWASAAYIGLALSAMMLRTPDAQADNKTFLPGTMLKSYQTECAACHLAYPPGMLPAQSWAHLMKGLENHYGTDASIDAETITQIGGWLQVNAGTYKRVKEAPPEDRITQSAWFVRKHREVGTEVWLRPAIKSASNCTACHTQADQGDYRERNIRIPQ